MIRGRNMSNIAIIPARSGSKGLKDKNIKDLNGIPLIAYSIKCALDSGMFDCVFVSTDSIEYAKIAEEYGANANFLRSEKNSSDKAGSWDVVREVLEQFEKEGQVFDKIMLLQPTSPLRTVEDIRSSFEMMRTKSANAIVSVAEMEHSPLWCNVLPDDLSMEKFYNDMAINMPRQELPKYYRLNGAIYLLKKQELQKVKMFREKCYAYIMPIDRSIDIDTEFDFKMAQILLNQGKGK